MKSSTTRAARLAALALALVACNSDRLAAPLAPVAGSTAALSVGPAGPVIRISEFHYDNTGTDAGERIEISGPAGYDLSGWQLVRYNGDNVTTGGVTYGTTTLGGVIPDQCSGRGTVVVSYASNGIQNGPRDGFALLNSRGRVIELLSYQGVFTATNGPAVGLTSTDVGVTQGSSTPVGASIERTATGSWIGRSVNSFGACNDNDGNVTLDPEPTLVSITITPSTASVNIGATANFTAKGLASDGLPIGTGTLTWSTPNPEILTVNPATGAATGTAVGDTKVIATNGTLSAEAIVHVLTPPPPPPPLPGTRVSEFHYDNSQTDANEGVEIEADAGVDLAGWSLVFYTGSSGAAYKTVELSGAFAATCNGRGAISFAIPGIQNGGFDDPEPDGFALVHGTETVQFLSYEGTFTATDGPAAGLTSVDVGVEEGSTSATQSIQLNTAGAWERKASTFGQVNACASATGTASIFISSNGPDTLVVGWQRRAFVSYKDANGTTVSPTPTITWSSDTPTIASVDSRGYATALAAGTAVIRATIGTTTSTYNIAVIEYEAVKAQYRSHVEFGIPSGADPSNSVMLFKPGYVTSYNPARGGPNWVSWNINATTFGDAERCECFSGDPALPEAQRIVDFDYVGGGYDRGHMVQSESRTSTHSENAATFLLTNILPQAANNNQGPWLGFENFLNDQARVHGKQVYVVAGGEYAATPTTLKDEGRVAIPDYTWKVAIVVNSGAGLADVHSPSDITVYAVRIPNLLATAPAKNNNYAPWTTTVDAVEALTGYDFFAALPDNIERIVEANDHPPVAVITGPATGTEGSPVTFDATSSTDPDAGDVLSYQWTFDNGATSSSASPTLIFTDNGSYTATLTVTDKYGATAQVTKTITIDNVAPTVAAFAGPSILRGETYAIAGTFSDPGADTFTATVNYGDGSGTQALILGSGSFALAHAYETAGTFTVTVTVTDDDGASNSRTATVTVASAAQAIGTLSDNVAGLASNAILTHGEATALEASLRNALKSVQMVNAAAANGQLGAFINKVEALERSDRLAGPTAASLIAYAQRIIAAIE